VSKTILIAGTSSGLGEAAVFEYAHRGWNVVAAMRNVAAANPRFAELQKVVVTHIDVTDRPSIDAALALTGEKFGQLDALLNVAGYGQVGAIEEVTPAELRAEYETNVVGVLNVVQAVLPQFRARRGGHILVVGSMSAHLSFPTMTVYASSKAAVRSLVEGLQMECEPLGVKITLVEPAGYMTKFFDNVKKRYAHGRLRRYLRQDATQSSTPHTSATSPSPWAPLPTSPESTSHHSISLSTTDGLTWVRDTQAARLAEYAKWEHITKKPIDFATGAPWRRDKNNARAAGQR